MATLLKCTRCDREFYTRDEDTQSRCPHCHALNENPEPVGAWGWVTGLIWLLVAILIFAAIASDAPPGGAYFRVGSP